MFGEAGGRLIGGLGGGAPQLRSKCKFLIGRVVGRQQAWFISSGSLAGYGSPWLAMAGQGWPWPAAKAGHGWPRLAMVSQGQPWPAKAMSEGQPWQAMKPSQANIRPREIGPCEVGMVQIGTSKCRSG